jgi:hypothetical protein
VSSQVSTLAVGPSLTVVSTITLTQNGEQTTMMKKGGKYYADWRDSQGIRHRAAFPTEAEAVAHQKIMRAIRNPKGRQAALRGPSLITSKRTKRTPTQRQRSSSSSQKSKAKRTPGKSHARKSKAQRQAGKNSHNTRARTIPKRSVASSAGSNKTARHKRASAKSSPTSANPAQGSSSQPMKSAKAS